MLTLFMLLAAAGGILRLALAWLLKQRWGVSISVPQALAGALVVLAGLPEFIKPIPPPPRSNRQCWIETKHSRISSGNCSVSINPIRLLSSST